MFELGKGYAGKKKEKKRVYRISVISYNCI